MRKRDVGSGAVDVALTTDTFAGATVATITFPGAFTDSGSLENGNYELEIDSTELHDGDDVLDIDQDGIVGGSFAFGAERTDKFFRLFGDSDGNGAVNRGDSGELRDHGRAARTIQARLTAMKGFTKGLTEHHKLPRDPLASVKKPNPRIDRRHESRILLPAEWWRLEVAMLAGPLRYGMTGHERLLLYRTAIHTALRSSSLRSLTRGRLYLDAGPPYITCKARTVPFCLVQSCTSPKPGHIFNHTFAMQS